jgi:AcrR family transcriptional regulator
VEAILTATAQVLVRETFARMTTTRVAEVAGVSVGSLYQYFPSKIALARAVVERHAQEIAAAMARAAFDARALPLEGQVAAVIGALLAAKNKKRALARVLDTELPHAHYSDIVETTARGARALVREMLEAHRSEVRVRDPELAAYVVVSAVEGVVRAAALDRTRDLEDPRLLAEMVRLALGYIRRVA